MNGFKHTIKKDFTPYFLTTTVIDWLPIFEIESIRKIVIDSLNFLIEKKNLIIYGYCIMNNHLHMIANTESPYLLKDVMRDFKRFTSTRITEALMNFYNENQDFLTHFHWAAENHSKQILSKVWKDGNHAIELYSTKFFRQKLNYIHFNPVRAGYVDYIEDWPFSSAKDYLGGQSVLKKVHFI
jgi:REP element-mobilizing transposase RayT